MVVLAQRPLPVRPPGTQTSAGAGGNKIATWRMWTPRLPGLGTVKERLTLASCWRSPCLMRENFADTERGRELRRGRRLRRRLVLAFGWHPAKKASPWGL